MVRNLKLFHIGSMFLLYCWSVGGCSRLQGQVYEAERISIHTYKVNGLMIRTGGLICTSTGGQSMPGGLFWKLYGELVYGDMDHIAVYVAPGGHCVEAGAKFRVVTFDVVDNTWYAYKIKGSRCPVEDNLYGVAYLLAGRSLSSKEEARIRGSVARYCIKQAEANKPYNPILTDSKTEKAFYCSQLAYKAYLKEGIDLNTGAGVPEVLGMESIILPQEIWMGCEYVKAKAIRL